MHAGDNLPSKARRASGLAGDEQAGLSQRPQQHTAQSSSSARRPRHLHAMEPGRQPPSADAVQRAETSNPSECDPLPRVCGLVCARAPSFFGAARALVNLQPELLPCSQLPSCKGSATV